MKAGEIYFLNDSFVQIGEMSFSDFSSQKVIPYDILEVVKVFPNTIQFTNLSNYKAVSISLDNSMKHLKKICDGFTEGYCFYKKLKNNQLQKLTITREEDRLFHISDNTIDTKYMFYRNIERKQYELHYHEKSFADKISEFKVGGFFIEYLGQMLFLEGFDDFMRHFNLMDINKVKRVIWSYVELEKRFKDGQLKIYPMPKVGEFYDEYGSLSESFTVNKIDSVVVIFDNKIPMKTSEFILKIHNRLFEKIGLKENYTTGLVKMTDNSKKLDTISSPRHSFDEINKDESFFDVAFKDKIKKLKPGECFISYLGKMLFFIGYDPLKQIFNFDDNGFNKSLGDFQLRHAHYLNDLEIHPMPKIGEIYIGSKLFKTLTVNVIGSNRIGFKETTSITIDNFLRRVRSGELVLVATVKNNSTVLNTDKLNLDPKDPLEFNPVSSSTVNLKMSESSRIGKGIDNWECPFKLPNFEIANISSHSVLEEKNEFI